MDGMWIQNIIAVIALFLIPMTGLTVILTARLAFKPLVESLSKALRETGFATSPGLRGLGPSCRNLGQSVSGL